MTRLAFALVGVAAVVALFAVRARGQSGAGVGPLRYAPLGSLLDNDRAPEDIRSFYRQLHAPPYPRDLAAAETVAVPPWLRASIDGAARPARVVHVLRPREADPDVRAFLAANLVLFDRDGPTDAPLLVWLTGTGGTPLDAGLFLPAAADAGYRVISLEFDDLPAGTQLCEADPDPACFANFRADRLFGDGAMPALATPAAEAIVRRLSRLLALLARRYPDEGWDRYLANGEPNWPSLVLSGHSMGSGMAAYLAKRRAVRRVILSSSPWDHQAPGHALAPWLASPSATPPDRWVAIAHAREPMAPLLSGAYAALGLRQDQVRVATLTPFGLLSAPATSMVFHGAWFGPAVPLTADWRPTADVRALWSFLLGRPIAAP